MEISASVVMPAQQRKIVDCTFRPAGPSAASGPKEVNVGFDPDARPDAAARRPRTEPANTRKPVAAPEQG